MTNRSRVTSHHTSPPARRLVPAGAVVALLCAVVVPLAAHDFWIEPTGYTVDAGKIVGIRARVGDGFLGDPVPRDPALLEELVAATASGRQPVAGRDGDDPAGLLRAASAGLHVIGYLGKPSRVELSAEKFNEYLAAEGLDGVIDWRARRGQTGKGAKEIFTRCAKTLVHVGGGAPGDRDRVLGCRAELVAEASPYALQPGRALGVRLTFDGRPLEGALIVAMPRKNAAATISARSDREGRVRFTLPSSGVWMIKTVHMVPAPAGANADWASYWASLTFELPRAAATEDRS
jgi:uncharacterized GH25 family protein